MLNHPVGGKVTGSGEHKFTSGNKSSYSHQKHDKMKHILTALALLATTTFAYAQNSTDYDGAGSRKKVKALESRTNEFTGTEITSNSESAIFSHLPDMHKATWAVITNEEGETLKSARVSPASNAIDIHKLDKGIYCVTLVYRNKNQKAFVLTVGD